MSELSIEPTVGAKPTAAAPLGGLERLLRSRGGRERPLIGIDIGSKRTKVVVLRRVDAGISLQQAAVFPTPPEAMTAG